MSFFNPLNYPNCAVVYDSNYHPKKCFCVDKKIGHQISNDLNIPFETECKKWYQESIYWAQENGFPHVKLGEAEIIIDDTNKLDNFAFPFSNGIGIHVPSNIHLSGSKNSRILVQDGTTLHSIILVSNRPDNTKIYNSSVSNLTIIGTTNPDFSSGQHIDDYGTELKSIHELKEAKIKIPPPTDYPNNHYIAVSVDSSMTGEASVDVHHLKIGHVSFGIAYGWNTRFVKEDEACMSKSDLEFSFHKENIEDSGKYDSCFKMELITKDGSLNGTYFVGVKLNNNEVNYCPIKPYEFIGRSKYHLSRVYNNSIFDTRVGINIVGGNVEVSKNVVVRHPKMKDGRLNEGFGLSTDGHFPYSRNTYYYDNYVSGFSLGFLTDGSQYVQVDDPLFESITGYKGTDFEDFQHYLNLQQIIYDYAQAWYANSPLESDWYRGYIDHLYILDNVFVNNLQGINLYRVNWAFVGNNTIQSSSEFQDASKIGLGINNTINSWIFGNTFKGWNTAVYISGIPGFQSHWGSCYNGIGQYYHESRKEFYDLPNHFENNEVTVETKEGSCFE
jgi:hypothetical protein